MWSRIVIDKNIFHCESFAEGRFWRARNFQVAPSNGRGDGAPIHYPTRAVLVEATLRLVWFYLQGLGQSVDIDDSEMIAWAHWPNEITSPSYRLVSPAWYRRDRLGRRPFLWKHHIVTFSSQSNCRHYHSCRYIGFSKVPDYSHNPSIYQPYRCNPSLDFSGQQHDVVYSNNNICLISCYYSQL